MASYCTSLKRTAPIICASACPKFHFVLPFSGISAVSNPPHWHILTETWMFGHPATFFHLIILSTRSFTRCKNRVIWPSSPVIDYFVAGKFNISYFNYWSKLCGTYTKPEEKPCALLFTILAILAGTSCTFS